MSKGMARLGLVAVLLAIGLLGAAPAAQAVSFDLTSDHCTGTCGPTGTVFGTVTLTQNGANVDITVSLASGFSWAKTGSADFQEFKFNGAPSLASITVDQTFSGQTLAAQTGTFNGDGTGNFTFGIACTTCGNGSLAPLNSNIVFHVAGATVAQLTQSNGTNIFVADVFSSLTGNTGPVDASAPTSTPEPSSTLLLSLGLLGVGVVSRKVALARG